MEKLPFGNTDFLSMDELLLNITGHFPGDGTSDFHPPAGVWQ